VLACEPLRAARVVARPDALDAQPWAADAVVLRLAPDDALVVGAAAHQLTVAGDPDAIVVDDAGFVGVWLSADHWAALAGEHVEWPAPPVGRLGQGLVAGVRCKVWADPDGRTLLACAAAHRAELEERLG
jgi:hypothetical protein